MRTQTTLLLLLVSAFTSATAIRARSHFTRYKSWNTRMYPVWKDGDPRFRNCWSGGEVTFDLKNDAPTLTGARATFNININFPPNQTVLADGQVVWARNCTVNGRQYQQGQPVYPDQETQALRVFPDGTPFRSQRKKPHYVFVWKTWGRYWQVADGPSSSLTIGTDNVPLGSYNMEVVIYHCRGKDKFIPLGYASTNFIVTDQVPFTISLAQVNDVNQDDTNFIQNRAIAFNVMVHDPSLYLNNADISFSWDFGDNSGTLITRERTVTHTYLAVGTFKPQVVLMASIPNGCGIPTAVVPVDPSAAPVVVVTAAADPAEGGDAIALDVPASDATPVAEGANPDDAAAVVDADTETAVIDAAAEDPAADVAADDTAAADTADAAANDVATADATATDVAAADATAADATATDTAAADATAADATATDVAAADATAADATATDVAVADATAADATAADATAADATAIDAATAVAAEDAAAENAAVEDAAAEDAAENAAEEDAAAEDIAAADTAAADAAAADAAAADAAAGEVATAEDVEAADVTETAADNNVVTDAPASVAPAGEGIDAVEAEAATPAAEEPVEQETEAAAEVPVDAATEGTVVEETDVVADEETVETVNEVADTVAPAEPEVEGEAAPTEIALVIAKRQAPELTADCMVYRYGSLSTTIDVVQGIESVEIVQMANVVSLETEMDQNAVDVTISCQGSLPSEVCTVISDADCITPVETVCSVAMPSPDCQMILRQFFNDSGVFCLNVSLTNDVSLAVTSARVSVSVASGGSPAGTAATVLGMMVLACVVCCVGLMYRRFKQYQPLREDHDGGNNGGVSTITSVPMMLWNLLSRQSPGESRPLLQGRIV
ncbi:premelanosome protein a [Synchiropus splendidus]|uniref:premelanosome protein a n=1 Tax=Synchiropus splendidus TaxID=270530 RepID=UPI00237D9D44|nr:premelanosome protein a [Synchiropus splendidus]